jgi:hypothetical protein
MPSLAEQDLGAEEGDELEGPTAEVPYRYTEQALNPRAAAVSGRAQRDPRARSGYTGLGGTQQREQGLASQFGMTPEDMLAIENLRARFIGSDRDRIGRDHEALREQRADTGQFVQRFGKDFRTGATFDELKEAGVPDHLLFRAGLTDKQALYRSFSRLPEEIRGDFNLSDPRRVAALTRMGTIAPREFERVFEQSPAYISEHIRDMQPSKSGGNFMSKLGRAVTVGGVSALMGGALAAPLGLAGAAGGAATGAASGLVSTGLNSLISGQFDPMQAAISVGGGALLGGVGGYLSPGSQQISETAIRGAEAMGLRGTGMALGDQVFKQGFGETVQALGAGGAGAFSGGASGLYSKLKAMYNSPTGQAVVSAGKGLGKAAMQAGAEHQAAQGASEFIAEQAARSPQYAGMHQGIFSRKLPDNPFYEEEEDLFSSSQAGAV